MGENTINSRFSIDMGEPMTFIKGSYRAYISNKTNFRIAVYMRDI